MVSDQQITDSCHSTLSLSAVNVIFSPGHSEYVTHYIHCYDDEMMSCLTDGMQRGGQC